MAYTIATIGGRAALVSNGKYFDIQTLSGGALDPNPMGILDRGDELSRLNDQLESAVPNGDFDAVVPTSPVPSPSKVFGIGLNYRDHATESNLEVPDNPLVFTKFPSCITGPYDDIHLRSDRCDYEGEIVVVIGKPGKDIPAARAWDHVFGITAGQDISDRVVQLASKPPHFDLGKSFDTFGPIGPVVVSPDQFPDREAIGLRTLVNGETRQQSSTTNLIFSIPFLVEYLSRITTLSPGDLIFTGTPEGVGMPQKKWLAEGDEIITEVDGVGRIVNRCVRSSDHELPVRRKSA